ncbi:MAG: outer membrane protein assembly factor BamA [Desulfobacterales bacterium]|nr:outer membrane protein assembly factor BamA [Desulfobacterales bacterium]
MGKKLCFIIIFISLISINHVYAKETPRILIIPFGIESSQNLQYLSQEIPTTIASYLKKDGAYIVDYKSPEDIKLKDFYSLKTIGKEANADYVISGTLKFLDNDFTTETYIIDVASSKEPDILFHKGTGIENLIVTVTEIAKDISKTIFKFHMIEQIIISGNNRIEKDAILRLIKAKPGDLFIPERLSDDLKTIYAMGYFDDITIEEDDGQLGKIVTFNVKEKATIREIKIKGESAIEEEDIKETLNLKTGAILNIFKIKNNVQRIDQLYKDKNYHNVEVSYNIIPLEHNQADLEFVIKEHEKSRIKKITFEGNTQFSDKDLKKQMKTNEKGFFYWLTSSGDLNNEDLNQDAARIQFFYQNNGYMNARVSDPEIKYDGEKIFVKIKIEEGQKFKIGKIDIEGDLKDITDTPKEKIIEGLKISKEKFYKVEELRNDINSLTEMCSDKGYAYAEIIPKVDPDPKELSANITFTFDKGKKVFFEKINISGNTKTRDKVIRRELPIYEQELYSGQGLKRGIRNLYKLDYFEDIKVNTLKGSSDDKMMLDIEVKEKPTGAFSFGGGYSTVENLFLTFSISQRNFLGRGQTLQAKAEMGGTTDRYTLSFTEPWLFDTRLSVGFDLYNWQKDYGSYDKDGTGGALRFGYPVFDYTRLYVSYSYEVSEIRNVDIDAPQAIKDMSGINVTSSVSTTLLYDSKDRIFNPTEGSEHSFTIQYTGGVLGGDIGFTKYLAETGWYFPLFWGTVGFIHGRAGYVMELPGQLLPVYERFYLGGINTIRGFNWKDISPLDSDGAEIGGDKFVQFNLEFLFPLVKKAGLVGLLFIDGGNTFDNHEPVDIDFGSLRETAGYGIRWYSPIGPIRLECGYILSPKEGERTTGRWEFTMGMAF